MAGGPVVTKGASQIGKTTKKTGKRAGGNVVTKGPNRKAKTKKSRKRTGGAVTMDSAKRRR